MELGVHPKQKRRNTEQAVILTTARVYPLIHSPCTKTNKQMQIFVSRLTLASLFGCAVISGKCYQTSWFYSCKLKSSGTHFVRLLSYCRLQSFHKGQYILAVIFVFYFSNEKVLNKVFYSLIISICCWALLVHFRVY